MCSALGGIDALVFTAGIGEHAATIRKAVCDTAEWLGICLNDERNAAGNGRISAEDSRVSVWVVPTKEELMVAMHTIKLALGPSAAASARG